MDSTSQQKTLEPPPASISDLDRRRHGSIGLLRIVAYVSGLGGILMATVIMKASEPLGWASIFAGIMISIFLIVVAGIAEDIFEIRKSLSK